MNSWFWVNKSLAEVYASPYNWLQPDIRSRTRIFSCTHAEENLQTEVDRRSQDGKESNPVWHCAQKTTRGEERGKKGTKARLRFPERPFLMMNKIFNGERRRETPLDARSLSLFARPSVSVRGGASEWRLREKDIWGLCSLYEDHCRWWMIVKVPRARKSIDRSGCYLRSQPSEKLKRDKEKVKTDCISEV